MRLIRSPLINTPLLRGVQATRERLNRFSGLSRARETVETVSMVAAPLITPLKRGVNEMPPLLPLGPIALTDISMFETL